MSVMVKSREARIIWDFNTYPMRKDWKSWIKSLCLRRILNHELVNLFGKDRGNVFFRASEVRTRSNEHIYISEGDLD